MSSKVALPICISFLAFAALWFLLDLPPEEELRAIIANAFATYGPAAILIGAFLEGVLLVGLYFPGSILIFMSVALAPTPLDAVRSVILVTTGLYLAYLFNYTLGKYGWYRLLVRFGLGESVAEAKAKLEAKKSMYIFGTFWAPGFAAITATAAGILHVPFFSFAITAFSALALWNIFWGTIVFLLGEAAMLLVGYKVMIAGVVLWLVYDIARRVILRMRAS